MNEAPSLLVKSCPYWPYTELPMRSRPVPFTITSVRKLRLPAVASATFSSGMLIRAPFAGGVAMTQRGGDRQRGVDPARDIPGGQHMIDRGGQFGGSGHQWKSDAGVDGVVHAGRPVGAPGNLDMDEIRPLLHQVFIRMPLPPNHISDEHAALGDQALYQVLTLGRAHVRRNGSLALVQPRPVDADPVLGERPPVIVGRTVDRVDADHLGAQLGQGHPGQWHGDEAGDLDDPHPGERPSGIRCRFPGRFALARRRLGHPARAIPRWTGRV